jgi:carbon monoxide dehydrogenase subunit G
VELVNEFTVNRPIDEAWAVLTDIERIAPCLPGAELQEIEGDVYRGVVKVKVGPISAALKGEASFIERDDAAHRAVLKGDGRDTKGNGNASALITASLEETSPASAKCVVHTDLNMTGKVAQFGRGALGDISAKLMQQFAKNLDEMLATDATAPAATEPAVSKPAAATKPAATAEPAEAADTAASANTNGVATDAPAAPAKRVINGPAAEPIDAFSLGGSAVLKRLLPLLGGLVVLILALRRRKK